MRKIVIILVGLALSSNAYADDIDRAKRLFNEGVEELKKGQTSAAAQKFARAYELVDRAKYLNNWAMSEKLIGNEVVAANLFEEFTRHNDASGARVQLARKNLSQLDKQLFKLIIFVEKGGVLRVNQKEVRVRVGDKVRKPSEPIVGYPYRVDPKQTSTVTVTWPNGKIDIKRVNGKPGEIKELTFKAPKIDCSKPEFSGHPKCINKQVDCENPKNFDNDKCRFVDQRRICMMSKNLEYPVCKLYNAKSPDCSDPKNKGLPQCQPIVNCKNPENADHPDCYVAPTGPTRSQFGIFSRSDILVTGTGMTGALGLMYSPIGGLAIYGNGLYSRFSEAPAQVADPSQTVSRNKFGAEVGLRYTVGDWRLRPYIVAGVPVIFVDGALPGFRGSLGGDIKIAGGFHFTAEFGLAYSFKTPDLMVGTDTVSPTSVLFSAGLEVHL